MVNLAREHGRVLAAEVERVMCMPLEPVHPPIRTTFALVPLELGPHTRDVFEAESTSADRFRQRQARLMLDAYDAGRPVRAIQYPVQSMRFGDELAIVALGGEPVVDYSLRLKQDLSTKHLIVAGYANDVMAYIPSRRVLREGGYEAIDNAIYYGLPGPFDETIEDRIVAAVRRALE